MAVPDTPEARRELLADVYREARSCVLCPHLAQTRTQVVFGAGNADADLLFIGEAPGSDEDRDGVPFVGRAGKLLTQLLGEVGIAREDVFIANVLKCRPPDNRNPTAPEIANCSRWLYRQLELIQPTVVVTLGNFATRLLREDQTSITKIRGQVEVRTIGPRAVRLLPVLHPAAALYTPANRSVLAGDLALIPALLNLGPPPQPQEVPQPDETAIAEARAALELERAAAEPPAPAPEPLAPAAEPDAPQPQLGLF
jgi:DNA polymerase